MKKIVISALLLFLASGCFAQEALWSKDVPIVSPRVNADNSVTFSYVSPTAKTVRLIGDFLPIVKIVTEHGSLYTPGVGEFSQDDNGVWTFTTEPLEPELYLYNFMVDSVLILDPLNLHVNRDVTSFTNQLLVPGENSAPYNENDIPHGTVSKMWYDSRAFGSRRRMSIYTPPGYESSGASYPVLYLLHGMGGDENAWLENGRLAQIMDWLIEQGLAAPMIVVTPNGNPQMQISPADNGLLRNTPQMAEFQVIDGTYEASFPEIVDFVDKNFHTVADSRHRTIAGLSMGGFHSLEISKEYPDMFGYVGLFSAATPRALHSEGYIDGASIPPVYNHLDEKLRTQFDRNPQLYWIAIGKDDFLYDSNTEFRKTLDDAGYSYTYVESDGGHTWRNWRNYLKTFVPLLFK